MKLRSPFTYHASTIMLLLLPGILAAPQGTPVASITISEPPYQDPPTPTETEIASPVECERAGIYICEDVNWSGSCVHHTPCLGGGDDRCYQLDGKASSIGPDLGYTCYFYQNGLCRDLMAEKILKLEYPGSSNLLETELGDWNDKVYGVQCFKTPATR